MAKSPIVLTPKFRTAFLNAFKPQPGMSGGSPKYGVVMLFPKNMGEEDAKLFLEMKKTAEFVAMAYFGGKIPVNFVSPFKDGDLKPEYDGYKGHWCVSATTNADKFPAPGVVGGNKQPIIDQSEVYSGCYMRAKVSVFAYGNAPIRPLKGVSFGLIHLQKMADGEPFSGRGKAEDAFDAVAGADVSASSTSEEVSFL